MRSNNFGRRFLLFGILALSTVGCLQNHSDSPFGSPNQTPLLRPFAGKWTYDLEKTLALKKVGGIPEAQLALLRKLQAQNPTQANLHSLTFDGNVAVGLSDMEEEYRFFALHLHDSKVCGKAWHHEDRHDPGDMSKCYVRLSKNNEDLIFEVNMLDGGAELNDPDIAALPIEEDVSKCQAVEQKPGEWEIYVFTRSK